MDRRSAEEAEQLARQAQAWVRRLTSGDARQRDAQALQRWCATSEAHRQALDSAWSGWQRLRPAAELAGQRDPALAALRARPAGPAVLPRRLFLGGAVAASVASAGVLLTHPPLGLWPSHRAWLADHRTGVGEQRRMALAPGVVVDMNTRSSIAVRLEQGQPTGIRLIEGEVAVDVERHAQGFAVQAGEGVVQAAQARFEVRRLGTDTCVTCRAGRVDVAVQAQRAVLAGAQQLTYGAGVLPGPRALDATNQSDWREGILKFHDAALAQVIDEINRYRPGRVVLAGQALGQRLVSGRFHIHDLDKAIAQIQRLFRLSLTEWPGGIVILR